MTLTERLNFFATQKPRIHSSAYVSPKAVLMGSVTLEEQVSIWPGAVLRADINTIEIGKCTNLQDGTIVHLADACGVRIGDYVTVGHGAKIHACTIEDECLIGIGAIVLDGAHIGHHSIIAAGSVVTPGMIVPPGSMVMGVPGKVVRSLNQEQQNEIRRWAERYLEVSSFWKKNLLKNPKKSDKFKYYC
jgi:gamma-carbonic anhydrase